jgi:hypothetical protein
MGTARCGSKLWCRSRNRAFAILSMAEGWRIRRVSVCAKQRAQVLSCPDLQSRDAKPTQRGAAQHSSRHRKTPCTCPPAGPQNTNGLARVSRYVTPQWLQLWLTYGSQPKAIHQHCHRSAGSWPQCIGFKKDSCSDLCPILLLRHLYNRRCILRCVCAPRLLLCYLSHTLAHPAKAFEWAELF